MRIKVITKDNKTFYGEPAGFGTVKFGGFVIPASEIRGWFETWGFKVKRVEVLRRKEEANE